MAVTSRYLTFDGQFESGVLGAFRIIRGFANLKDLAEISVPYEMEDATGGTVIGQQRKLDVQHAELIRKYLEGGEQRFLPEVILSIRCKLDEETDKNGNPIGVRSADDDKLKIGRVLKSPSIRVHRLRVERKQIESIRTDKLIRRVDGNHRLALAADLKDDPAVPTKFLASFCFVLLGPASEEADDYSESLIFHTINSTALALESEHALKLILGQPSDYDMSAESEFAFSPELHFTRLLRDGLLNLPVPTQERLGARPLTNLRAAVHGLLELDPGFAKDLPTLRTHSQTLLASLTDIVTRLEPDQPQLCKKEFFIELAARVWKSTEGQSEHNLRVNNSVAILAQIGEWLGKDGMIALRDHQSLSAQILEIFTVVRSRLPKRVFLARWYPTEKDGEEYTRGKLRLKGVQSAVDQCSAELDVSLSLVDMGTETGGTFPIHSAMYDAIASADIIVIDLTGVRPNVCVEAGYALRNHEQNRLIFMFQPTDTQKAVPFDLNTFRYEPFTDTGEIPDKLKPHISAIIRGASAGTV
ncbi:hypothetical protein KMZ68_02125 [Bradyrhizobium sediminis]|uniref:DGQHR domain-containing protein n=1 Tax=Bradyrhizobium sediminis TaxID=2840469 RepID=A0A975RT83_9BRAD|nr:hypothetical protein [Bradyrhizobium sediminis]QWG18718.1 hypothetical protein KMZ68_02125 [Bradyrhizobium sediminis]